MLKLLKYLSFFRRRVPRPNEKETKQPETETKSEEFPITYQQYPPPRQRSDTDDSLDSNYQNKSSFQSVYQVSQDNLTYPDTGLNLPNYYPDPKYDTDVSVKTDNYSLYSESDYFDENTHSLPNFAYEFDPNITDLQLYFESNTFNPIYSEYEYKSVSCDDSGSELNNFDEITVVNNRNKEVEEKIEVIEETVEEKSEEANDVIEKIETSELIKELKEEEKKIEKTIEETKELIKSVENLEKIEVVGPPVEEKLLNNQEFVTTITIDDNPKTAKKDKKSPVVKRSNSFRKPLNFITKNISRAFGDNHKHKKQKLSDQTDNQFYSSLPDINASKYLEKCEKIDRKLRKCDKYPLKNADNRNRFVVNIGQHFNLPQDDSINIPVDFEIKISKVPKKKDNVKIDKNNNEKLPDTNLKTKVTKRISESQSQEKYKISTLPKITEVIEKKEEKKVEPRQIKTIRNFTKINEKPVNTYESPTKSLDYNTTTKQQFNSLPIDIPKVRKKSAEMDIEVGKVEHFKTKTPSPDPEQEYQEKIETMKCFWNKMLNEKEAKDEKEKEIEKEKPVSPKLVISHFESLSNGKNDSGKTSPKPEPCKIVDVQSKIENVRKIFEQFPEKPKEIGQSLVETNKKIFEPKIETRNEKNQVKDTCEIFENSYFPLQHPEDNPYESLNPSIVEIIDRNGHTVDEKSRIPDFIISKNNTLLKAKEFENGPEFDHVRYKVMKSDLFQKNIFANYDKESQFDGLMQYLQDYSFQELLIDNNIVIIEPIRSKIEHQDNQKKQRKLTQILPKINQTPESKQSSLKRHFFYHPIRVNREVNDEELPNPDTVKQVRQIFEKSTPPMNRSQSSKELDNPKKKTIRYSQIDPDRDHCSDISDHSEKNSKKKEIDNNIQQLDSLDNIEEDNFDSLECDKQYISEDVLQKIRECGTCVTYYGGKILKKNMDEQLSPMTKAIMEEIRGWQRRNEECGCAKRGIKKEKDKTDNKESYQGIRFKLIKSNSCSSRLELVGTENLSDYRKKFLAKQKKIIEEQNLKNQQENPKIIKETINTVHKNGFDHDSPKIVGEEKKTSKVVHWEKKKDDKDSAIKDNKKLDDFKHYDIKKKPRKYDDMEFEHFEVLEK